MKVSTLWRASVVLVVLLGLILGTDSLFEDQVGKDDWYDSLTCASAFTIHVATDPFSEHSKRARRGPKTDHFHCSQSKGPCTTLAKSSSLISMEDLEETQSTSLHRKEQSQQCQRAP